MPNSRDFTLKKYEELCEAISSSGYTNVTIAEYLDKKNREEPIILIRHDVDENIRFALDMAEAESDCGIKATYYFRTRKNVYVPAVIDKIASYHHEIGYHYETLDKAKGDMDLAIRLFSEELALFRERYDVKTVCMHGNPLSRYDNRAIWEKCRLGDFDLLGEPYLSLDYDRFAYFSDSGRTWDMNKNKIKDVVEKSSPSESIRNSDDLINLIREGGLRDICILTHPERWPRTDLDYCYRYCVDLMYNLGKWVLVRTRRHNNNETGGSP